jgi:hypothetical protein
MKKPLLLLTAVTGILSMSSCAKDEPAPEPAALSVLPQNIAATATPSTYTVEITSNAAWTATSDGAWCTFAAAAGTGDGAITVHVAENAAVAPRTATLTVASGTITRTVAVTQAAAEPVLTLDKTTIDAPAQAGDYSVGVSSNAAWTATSDETWCTLSSAAGTGDGAITVHVAENAAVAPRTATLTVASGTITRTVAVTQASATAAAEQFSFVFTGSTIRIRIIANAITINWGDGTAPQSVVSDGVDNFYVPHTYASSGVYTVSATADNLIRITCDDSGNGYHITHLNIAQATKLQALYCRNNELTDLDISQNTALRYLYCYGNNLTSITASPAITSLFEYIDCKDNQLSASALNALFSDLPTTTAGGRIYIRNNPGTATCDPSIAAAKGWTVNTTL